MKKVYLCVAISVFIIAEIGFAQGEIRFKVPNFPPYQYHSGDRFEGIGVELIKKIMNRADIPYSLHAASDYGAAVESLRKGTSDGFFLASQNTDRDEIAVFSGTLLLNSWCWFLDADSMLKPSSPSFKSKAKVGTYLDSNTHKWLEKNGYRVLPLKTVEALPGCLLASKRVDAVFLAELAFVSAAEKSGVAGSQYTTIVQETKPFGLYLAKKYLSENPEAMRRIHAAIRSLRHSQ